MEIFKGFQSNKVDFKLSKTFLSMKLMHFEIKVTCLHSVNTYKKNSSRCPLYQQRMCFALNKNTVYTWRFLSHQQPTICSKHKKTFLFCAKF